MNMCNQQVGDYTWIDVQQIYQWVSRWEGANGLILHNENDLLPSAILIVKLVEGC
jgi:hypothetical protein